MLSPTEGLVWLLAEGSIPWWVWLLLFAGLLIVLILPRRLAKRSKMLDEARHRGTADGELRDSMDRLLVELQETAREINATIDTKMIALNGLIEEADRRIRVLKGLEGPGGKDTAEETPVAPRTPSPPEEPPSEEARRRRELEHEIHRLADEGKTELEIARITDTPRGEVELVLSLRQTHPDETSSQHGETP